MMAASTLSLVRSSINASFAGRWTGLGTGSPTPSHAFYLVLGGSASEIQCCSAIIGGKTRSIRIAAPLMRNNNDNVFHVGHHMPSNKSTFTDY
jgi:hypothetical protein